MAAINSVSPEDISTAKGLAIFTNSSGKVRRALTGQEGGHNRAHLTSGAKHLTRGVGSGRIVAR